MQGLMYVTGKLGEGKGIFLMHQVHQYYRAGRRVAANFDINPEYISTDSDNPISRIPDRPRIEDLELLGRGCPEDDKEAFGCLVLDEAGTWLNCRNFRDKGRKELLDWFLHSRKLGWDVYVGVQNEGMVDNQVFLSTGEHITLCQRAFNVRIPFFTDLLEIIAPKSFGRMAKKRKRIFPHYVTARTYKGSPSRTNKPLETLLIKATDYYDYYDTNYSFTEQLELRNDGSSWDARASFSILPGKTLSKWYKSKCKTFSLAKELSKLALLVLLVVGAFVWFFSDAPTSSDEVVQVYEPQHRVVEKKPVIQNSFPVDISKVYISGSLGWRSSSSDSFEYQYVLESPEGVFHPDDVGLSVVSVSRCVARVIDSISGSSAVLRCRAFEPRAVRELESDSEQSGDVSNVAQFLSL